MIRAQGTPLGLAPSAGTGREGQAGLKDGAGVTLRDGRPVLALGLGPRSSRCRRCRWGDFHGRGWRRGGRRFLLRRGFGLGSRRLATRRFLGGFLGPGLFFHRPGRGIEGGIVRRGDAELGLVVDQPREPIIRGQLVIVIHLDGVERTVLRTEATTHADAGIDVELSRTRDRLARLILVTHDPDTLRRTNLGADATGRTAILARVLLVDQHGDVAEVLRKFALFFRILDGEDAANVRGLAQNLAPRGLVGVAIARGIAGDVVCKRRDRALQGDAEAFQDTKSKHGCSSSGQENDSAIGFTEHDVDAAQSHDRVGDLVADRHGPQGVQVDVGRGADVIPPGII